MMKNKNNVHRPHYSDSVIEDYKHRLGRALSQEGISSKDIEESSDIKEFMSNYVQENIVDSEMRNKLQGFTFKLSNIYLDQYGTSGEVEKLMFPVINKFKGYGLIETIYFTKRKDNTISTVVVPMLKSKIII